MIWHFFEVWVLMLAAFAIGCPIGALAYKLIAQSPLAELQGDFADVVGDLVDGIKSRLGIGPVWRPEYRRIIERQASDAEDAEDRRAEGAGQLDRLLGGGVPMITDQSDQAEGGTTADGVAAGIRAADAPGQASAAIEDEEVATARPVGLVAPRNGVPDDLQRIRGIGRKIEQRLNAIGIYHFGQIAAWTPAEMRWVAQQLAFPDRIDKDDWIGQAIMLAAGGDTGFVKSADRRRQRRRQKALAAALERQLSEDGLTDDVSAGQETDRDLAADETIDVETDETVEHGISGEHDAAEDDDGIDTEKA